MAPPEKDVMGARMHVESDPPGDGEPNPPRNARPKQKSKPDVELEPESETYQHKPPPKRSMSPPGLKLEGPGGWRMSVPAGLIIAVLAGGGGTAVGAKVIAERAADKSSESVDEIKLLRKEMSELAADVRAVRAGQIDSRSADRKLANYTEDSIAPIVASLRKLSVKMEYADDADDKADDIDFHDAPLNPKSPQIQPKAMLPAKPSL